MFLVTERLGYSVGVDEEGAPIEAVETHLSSMGRGLWCRRVFDKLAPGDSVEMVWVPFTSQLVTCSDCDGQGW